MKDHQLLLCDIKRNTSVESLCAGLPPFLLEYMRYVRSLDFEEAPNYCKLRTILNRPIKHLSEKQMPPFDWILRKEKLIEDAKLAKRFEKKNNRSSSFNMLKKLSLLSKIKITEKDKDIKDE